MSVPLWKIKRELKATYHQLLAVLIRLSFPLIRLKRILLPSSQPSPVKGEKILGSRVILYLVFPDSDDLSDRLDALDYFLECSASVVCVINGTISPQWLDQFAQRCAFVLTRENKGYDFGGYQRGVLFLNDLGHVFDHLHIINDSVLMPVVHNETIFCDIERCAITGFGGAVALPFDKRTEQGESSPQLVLSYWLYFSGSLSRSACFLGYWSRYVATSSKVLTVRYGERGLSRYMAAQGSPAAALHTTESVSMVLQGLDAEVLALILQYASFTDETFSVRCAHLLTANGSLTLESEAVRNFIREVARHRNFLHSFCYLTYEVLRIPFIKKTQIRLPYLMRQQYIAAVAAGKIARPADRIWNNILKISR